MVCRYLYLPMSRVEPPLLYSVLNGVKDSDESIHPDADTKCYPITLTDDDLTVIDDTGTG